VNFAEEKDVVAKLKEMTKYGPDVAIEAVGCHYTKSLVHKVETAIGLETDSGDTINEIIKAVRKVCATLLQRQLCSEKDVPRPRPELTRTAKMAHGLLTRASEGRGAKCVFGGSAIREAGNDACSGWKDAPRLECSSQGRMASKIDFLCCCSSVFSATAYYRLPDLSASTPLSSRS
jgi:hypothetical protein